MNIVRKRASTRASEDIPQINLRACRIGAQRSYRKGIAVESHACEDAATNTGLSAESENAVEDTVVATSKTSISR